MKMLKSLLVLAVLCGAVSGCSGGPTSSSTVNDPPIDTPADPPVVPPPPQHYDRPTVIQAEDATTKSGGRMIPRSAAEGAHVYHLEKPGEEIAFAFANLAPATWQITVRYSNADTTASDLVEVFVDATRVGSFKTRNTEVPGSLSGSGWNVFTVSPVIPLNRLEGAKRVTLRLRNSDGFGVDLDSVTFIPLD